MISCNSAYSCVRLPSESCEAFFSSISFILFCTTIRPSNGRLSLHFRGCCAPPVISCADVRAALGGVLVLPDSAPSLACADMRPGRGLAMSCEGGLLCRGGSLVAHTRRLLWLAAAAGGACTSLRREVSNSLCESEILLVHMYIIHTHTRTHTHTLANSLQRMCVSFVSFSIWGFQLVTCGESSITIIHDVYIIRGNGMCIHLLSGLLSSRRGLVELVRPAGFLKCCAVPVCSTGNEGLNIKHKESVTPCDPFSSGGQLGIACQTANVWQCICVVCHMFQKWYDGLIWSLQ